QRSAAATRIIVALDDSGVVQTAAVADTLPFASGGTGMVGDGADDTVLLVDNGVQTRLVIVGPAFFDTLDLKPLRGRTFDHRDTSGSTPVAVVTQSFARQRFAEVDPLGMTVEFQQRRWFIVGVVPDLRTSVLDGTARPTLFLPYMQLEPSSRYLVAPVVLMRFRGGGQPSVRELHSLIESAGSGAYVHGIQPLPQRILQAVGPVRLYAAAMSTVALFALALGGVGVGALIMYSVSRRTREF